MGPNRPRKKKRIRERGERGCHPFKGFFLPIEDDGNLKWTVRARSNAIDGIEGK